MMASNDSEDKSDDAAAETAAAEVAKTEEDKKDTAAADADKDVPMDDHSKTQTQEAEQTGETTITDSNAEKP